MGEFILVAFATWGITYGIVSGTAPEVPGSPNEHYHGETDGFAGPLNIYRGVRWLLWKVGADSGICRVCISFWLALFFSGLAVIDFPVTDWFLFGMAIHGAIVFYSNIVRVWSADLTKGVPGFYINDF